MSVHSQLTSSLIDTSEDEEAKRREAEKAAKKLKKGFTDEYKYRGKKRQQPFQNS